MPKLNLIMERQSMTTTLDRAIEDAKARGIDPYVIEALQTLTDEGSLEVRQLESGAFVYSATEAGRKRFKRELA